MPRNFQGQSLSGSFLWEPRQHTVKSQGLVEKLQPRHSRLSSNHCAGDELFPKQKRNHMRWRNYATDWSPYTCDVQFELGVSFQEPRTRQLISKWLWSCLPPKRLLTGCFLNLFSSSRGPVLLDTAIKPLWSCTITKPRTAFSAAMPEHYLKSPPGTQQLRSSKASFK